MIEMNRNDKFLAGAHHGSHVVVLEIAAFPWQPGESAAPNRSRTEPNELPVCLVCDGFRLLLGYLLKNSEAQI